MSGCAQWCPARMHTPARLASSATSCGCMPSIVNDARPPRRSASGGPTTRRPSHLGEPFEHVRGERALVRAHALHPELVEVVDRGAQADRLRDRRRAGLELPRQLVPGGALEVHGGDHVAAGEERRHLLEELGSAVQDADARGAERLVPRPAVEVGAERCDVDGHVRHRLRTVHDRDRAGGADARGHLRDGVDRAEHVGDVREGDEPHVAARELRVELLQRELAALVDLQVAELAPSARGRAPARGRCSRGAPSA